MSPEIIRLFNINFNNLTLPQAVCAINEMIVNNKKKKKYSFVVTPNIDHIVNIHKNKRFSNAYKKAELTLVDGAPIVFLSKLFKKSLAEKVSGADLTPKLLELAQENNYRVFIFGSLAGVADKAIEKIKARYDFPISSFSPPFGFENDELILSNCIRKVNDFQPDILLVSLGSPKGELFLYDNLEKLKAPFSIQVGASIDFIAGTVKRAPIWMQKFALEWFFRFLQEPKRMFNRYFVNDIYFIILVVRQLLQR